MSKWWNPVSWYTAVKQSGLDDLPDQVTSLGDALTNMDQKVVKRVVSTGNTLLKSGNAMRVAAAQGTVSTFKMAKGGAVYVIDQVSTDLDGVSDQIQRGLGDAADFSAELFEDAKSWAKDALALISPGLLQTPPKLGGANPLARDFMIGFFSVYFGTERATSVVDSWARDAIKKGYTMAMDFKANVSVPVATQELKSGVWVDNAGRWGFFADLAMSAGSISPSVSASVVVEIYMIFGGVESYGEEYYFLGADLDINGFIIGAKGLLSTSLSFAGFTADVGIGLDYDLFGGGNKKAKGAASDTDKSGSPSVSPSLPSLDIFSIDLLGSQARTYDTACRSTDLRQESGVTSTSAYAMSLKNPTVMASVCVGAGGGTPFADDVTQLHGVRRIDIYGSSYVTGIAIEYMVQGTERGLIRQYGSLSGTPQTLILDSGEYIQLVNGQAGARIDRLRVETSWGRAISVGSGGSAEFKLFGGRSRVLVGLFGSVTSELTQLGVFYRSGPPFSLRARHSSMLLDVPSSVASGSGCMQNPRSFIEQQEWLLVPVGTTEYLIIHRSSGLYLDGTEPVAPATSVMQGTPVRLKPRSGSRSQLWEFQNQPGAPGYYVILNCLSGMALDVYGGFQTSGTSIITWPSASAANQQWYLSPTEPCVYVFGGVDYTGTCRSLFPGVYDVESGANGLALAAIRSIRLPRGYVATVVDSAGQQLELTEDASHLGSMTGKILRLTLEAKPIGATIYADCWFSGTSQVVPPGQYDQSQLRIGGDMLSSLRVPAGWRVSLYRDPAFQGPSVHFTADCDDLRTLGWNDTASSVIVEAEPLGRVVLYGDPGYKGTTQVLGPGRHNTDTLASGVGDNRINSVKVPPGFTVALYKDADFLGTPRVLKADCSDLGDFKCSVSSVIVIPG